MGMLDSSSAAGLFASTKSDTESYRAQLAQFALLKGADYLSENNQDAAIKEFKTALAFDSTNATAHTYLAQIYQRQGKNEDAIKELKKVVQNDLTSATARNNLGSAYLKDKQYDNAEKELTYAARLDLTDPLANYTLGLLYTETGRYTDAETSFTRAGNISRNDANIPYGLGVLYNKMGRPEAAVQQLQRALALNDDFAAANYELGAAYVKMGKTDEAKEQLSILSSKDTGLASDLEYLLNTPTIAYIDETNNESFNSGLGAGTPLWMLDPARLSTPNSTIEVAVAIQFTNAMDAASVMDASNWQISKARGGAGGYYNNSMPTNQNEVTIPACPISVTYDATTRQAKVYFFLNQTSGIDILNGNNGATIDPSHLVFKFSGKDAAGRKMDTSADEIDGYSIRAF
jgi:tetratricopeptide (TPR) repeat protein